MFQTEEANSEREAVAVPGAAFASAIVLVKVRMCKFTNPSFKKVTESYSS